MKEIEAIKTAIFLSHLNGSSGDKSVLTPEQQTKMKKNDGNAYDGRRNDGQRWAVAVK